ncbi:hypothetical protein [Shimia aestuarii]|uniref:Uncharacterized protein n=1 Tax=Shimia aestuarii TaxID=254406 RepID=A0A1I4MDA2_9RHOB|nr:hypothetical protein [Shimia aestuarii]SFM01362.1 hypothetical protein SAMN04488042_10327 [Shimia aestuarii]
MGSNDENPAAYPAQAEECLPKARDAIKSLRATDAIFAEICDDYELLVGDLHVLSQCEGASEEDLQKARDLFLESLKGLTDEIRAALERASRRVGGPRGPDSTSSSPHQFSQSGEDT